MQLGWKVGERFQIVEVRVRQIAEVQMFAIEVLQMLAMEEAQGLVAEDSVSILRVVEMVKVQHAKEETEAMVEIEEGER